MYLDSSCPIIHDPTVGPMMEDGVTTMCKVAVSVMTNFLQGLPGRAVVGNTCQHLAEGTQVQGELTREASFVPGMKWGLQ